MVNKTTTKLGSFHTRVTRTTEVDLSSHKLQGLEKPIKFRFVDPIYAWSMCAYKLSKEHKLHFQYKPLKHRGQLLYGSSVATGDVMREACKKYSQPALIGLSYDAGMVSKRRSYTPILVSVANTDYAGLNSCVCIGYLPILNLGASVSRPEFAAAMHDLRQTCIGAIVDIIETGAANGFKCLFPDGHEKVLFPVLTRMEFDTKERYKFFCCAKQHACGIGSGPRQGHSALRPCTPHSSRPDLPAKRRIAARDEKNEAAASLERRGIHPSRRCTALEGRAHCVLTWPGRLHFGLFAYDVMHILYINCIGYLLDAMLDALTPKNHIELDRRARTLGPFRNPATGRTTRRMLKLSSTGYLSAEQKVIHLFTWSHAIGSRALLLPEYIRLDALLALSCLQTICFSTRGLRPFTREEHTYIFRDLGRRFFVSLSNMQHYKREQRIRNAIAYNIDKPERKRRRVPHWKPAQKLSDESANTASSDDGDVPPYYIRSDKIVPHSFVHFPEQVCMGGSHKFHDTAAQEATHPKYLGLAGSRTRAHGDLNRTSDRMLDYTLDEVLMEEICVQAKIDGIYLHGLYPLYPRYISTVYNHCTHGISPRSIVIPHPTVSPRHMC